MTASDYPDRPFSHVPTYSTLLANFEHCRGRPRLLPRPELARVRISFMAGA
jgi:hypothetical protein